MLDAALEGVARSLAIVLTLFGLAVGFVAIQDRSTATTRGSRSRRWSPTSWSSR